MRPDLHVVILAAASSGGMKSERSAVVHNLGGLPVIEHVFRAVDSLEAVSITVLVRHGADDVRAALRHRQDVRFVVQPTPKDAAEALRQGERAVPDATGVVLVLFGDAPLVRAETLRTLVDSGASGTASVTVLTPKSSENGAWRDEWRRIETRVDLADVSRVFRARRNRDVMLAGVTLEDPDTTFIDADVVIGAETIIGPGVELQEQTRIGERCRIRAGSRLTNATVGDDVTILDRSIVIESTVESGAVIGPYSHVRPQSVVGKRAHVGNFVELKKTTMGEGSKANHLAYLGDATIGSKVNIGAGTITCNYDGVAKHPTVIEDGVFIGSDSQLVAPVHIGKGAYVAAGSSIVKDVPADALAIARGRQENKLEWAAKLREQQDLKKRT